MKILVDIGNSRCKAAIEDESGLSPLQSFAWRDRLLHEQLDELWLKPLARRQPDNVIVSNVAGDGLLPDLSAWCCQRLGIAPMTVATTTEFQGLKNGYQEPETLGVDRWASMIGARAEYVGGLCVIDSGTATTVDVIDPQGHHHGGAILPGIYTMRRSLGKYTSALFAADGDINPFSDHTAGGIAGGTGFAAAGAMDRFVAESERLLGSVTTVVTGGDGVVLAALMNTPVIHDPLLVLKGVSLMSNELEVTCTNPAYPCADVSVSS